MTQGAQQIWICPVLELTDFCCACQCASKRAADRSHLEHDHDVDEAGFMIRDSLFVKSEANKHYAVRNPVPGTWAGTTDVSMSL